MVQRNSQYIRTSEIEASLNTINNLVIELDAFKAKEINEHSALYNRLNDIIKKQQEEIVLLRDRIAKLEERESKRVSRMKNIMKGE